MRSALLILFMAILIGMLAITTFASLDRSILDVGSELVSDPWFLATLADAYFGFITFFVWVAYKEVRWRSRIGWFFAIMLLGNIAMATYMLISLARLEPHSSWTDLLLRESSPTGA